MLVQFVPGSRRLKVGDRVAIVMSTNATLSGVHRVVKVTSTHYHVKVPHYSRPSLYRRDTGTGRNWGGSGIITMTEVDAAKAAFIAGMAKRAINGTKLGPGYRDVYFGEGEI